MLLLLKQWSYAQKLDVNILSLRESGAFDDLKVKWFQIMICLGSIETTSELFLTFTVITILSLVILVCRERYIIKKYLLKLFNQKRL
jgi:hypothetical protein